MLQPNMSPPKALWFQHGVRPVNGVLDGCGPVVRDDRGVAGVPDGKTATQRIQVTECLPS
jgi:hypothetical protein